MVGVIYSHLKKLTVGQAPRLKKNNMEKTLETTLKVSINTMLPTCDDKEVFNHDDDVQETQVVTSTVSGGW